MIEEGYQWIYIRCSNRDSPINRKYDFPKSKEEYLDHWGKWVILGERQYLDQLAQQLDPFVENKYIYSVKYLRQAPQELGFDQPAMCVYCDDREKEETWQILSHLGVTHKEWIYEEDTLLAWQPGGELFEKMATHRRLNVEQRERVARKFQQWNKEWLDHMFGDGDERPDIWNLEEMILEQKFERKNK